MTKNHGKKKLTPLQRKAVPAVVTTNTAIEAAAVAGCSESSIYKWLQEPKFKAAVADYEKVIRNAIDHRLTVGANDALDVIGGVMNGTITDTENMRVSVRLRAAIAWMETHIKTREDLDIERRLSALEAKNESNK
jgi:phage terminase small subunit